MSTPVTPTPPEVMVLASQYTRGQKTSVVYKAMADQFDRTSPTRPPLDIVKLVLDGYGVPSDYVTYSIFIYNTTGQLITVLVDALQGSFTDLVNGGSGSGSFQVPRNFIDVGWIDYNYRVQFYLSDSIDPWYDGFVVEFDQTQDDDDYDHDSITVQTDGWSSFMSRAIVTETLSPGVQSNGVDNGVEYADEYLIHLVTTYLDSDHFQDSYIASMPIGLDEISFDGTGLDQCVDTVVKQVLNETGNLFEWWVRGPRIGLPRLVIQPQQDPALQATAYYSPNRQRATAYFPEFKNSTMYDYSIQNSIADLANQIALYGGQDPATGLTVYGPFKDSTSISLYGLCQKQVTDTSLISTASLANYATAYLIMNGYPQPQGTYKKFAPTDAMRSGQWLQIMEPGLQDTGETYILGTNEIADSHPGNVKQVRCIQVVTSFGQSEDGDRIEQEVTFTAPRPYIDQAYYAAIGSATTTQQSQQAQSSNVTKVSTTYLQKGLDYLSNTPGAGATPPTVTFTPPTGVFYGATETTSTGGSNITLPLQDTASSETGDGTYHVVFAQNQADSFGTGTSGPALTVVKGALPPAYSNSIIPGWRFTVQNGAVVGNKDQRVQGGIGTNNYQPGSIPAAALQSGALTDIAVTSLNGETGAVTLESSDSSVRITESGSSIDLVVAAAGVTSIHGLSGVVGLSSPDSSVGISVVDNIIELEVTPSSEGVASLNGATGALTIESTDDSIGVTVTGEDINLTNNGVKTLQGASGAVMLESTDASVTITESGGVINLQASPTAGVAEVNGLTGDLTIESTDGSLTVTASGTNINIENTGVKSIAGEAGVVTLGSSDSSVTITPSSGHIDLKAVGGGGGGGTGGTGAANSNGLIGPVVRQSFQNAPISAASGTAQPLPNAVEVGNLLIAYGFLSAGFLTAPTGWTSLGNANGYFCFYRVADGTSEDTFATAGGSSVTGNFQIIEFINASAPYGFSTASSGPYFYEGPLITTTTPTPSLVITYFNANAGTGNPLVPPGWAMSFLNGTDYGTNRALAVASILMPPNAETSISYSMDDGSSRYLAQFAIPALASGPSGSAVQIDPSALTLTTVGGRPGVVIESAYDMSTVGVLQVATEIEQSADTLDYGICIDDGTTVMSVVLQSDGNGVAYFGSNTSYPGGTVIGSTGTGEQQNLVGVTHRFAVVVHDQTITGNPFSSVQFYIDGVLFATYRGSALNLLEPLKISILCNAATDVLKIIRDDQNIIPMGSISDASGGGGGGGGGGVTSLNSKTGSVSITSPDSSVTIGSSGSDITLEVSGGGGGGVTSLESLTGALTFTSPDSSVTIGTSGSTITLEASGGGGGGGGAVTPLIEFAFSGSTSTNSFSPTIGQKYTAIWEGSDNESFDNMFLGDGTGSNFFGVQYHASSGSAYTLTSNSGGDTVGSVINVPTTGGGNYRNMVLEFVVSATSSIEMRAWVDGCFIGYAQATVSNIAALFAQTGGQATTFFNIYPNWLITEPVATGGTTLIPYDSVVTAQSPTHYWPLNDAAGSSTAVDLVGSQPLTNGSTVIFGAPGLARDGAKSIVSSGASGNGLYIPAACQPTGAFSLSFIHAGGGTSGGRFFGLDGGGSIVNGAFSIGTFNGGSDPNSPLAYNFLIENVAWHPSQIGVANGRTHVAVTYDGTNALLYVNGVLVFQTGLSITAVSGAAGLIGGTACRIAKAALWSGTVLTQAQILAQVAAAGL